MQAGESSHSAGVKNLSLKPDLNVSRKVVLERLLLPALQQSKHMHALLVLEPFCKVERKGGGGTGAGCQQPGLQLGMMLPPYTPAHHGHLAADQP